MHFKDYLPNSSIIAFAAVFLVIVPLCAETGEVNYCIECHIENEIMPEDYIEADVHEQAGLSCAGCHGGDPSSDDMDEAMSSERGYMGIPDPASIPDNCGKCHNDIEFMRVFQPRIQTDQVAQYWTSGHGMSLSGGEERAAQCASCHSAHRILPADDPRSSVHALNIPATCDGCHGKSDLMASFNMSTDQLDQYASGVHGQALLERRDVGSPACNDCHGNHGAAPPGAASVIHICGSCHLNNMEYFNSSPMAQDEDALEYHSCETCHSNHAIMEPTDALLDVSAEYTKLKAGGSLCTECHSPGDEGYETALTLYHSLRGADSVYQEASFRMEDIQIKGMNDIDMGYLLQDSKQNLIQLRTLVHAFDSEAFIEKAEAGVALSNQAIDLADNEVREFYTRRRGFGISTLAFVLLAIALYLHIRYIDKSRGTGPNRSQDEPS